ncbi:MAG: CDP-alcohol phosphatidyltransferase family protein [Gemmatimonadetes bacterium]|nr:CDP-alcohol phosphatidyltransferase family protein [Gemmatimonadota bacterium]
MSDSKREMTFLLAGPERTLLTAIAARIPSGLRPNHFTVIGVLGAVGTGVGYALSSVSFAWLWFASLMLAVNWFGDSLDGTLARVRNKQRPRYGYYIDHLVDAFNTAAIGIGVGLSPLVNFEVALMLVIVYLTLSINVYLESSVFGVFKIAYGVLGPTEARIGLIALNSALVLGLPLLPWVGSNLTLLGNSAIGGISLLMFAMLVVRFGKNLRRLALMEPQFDGGGKAS